MKKVATIILSAVFGMGVAFVGSALASEAGMAMPSMKDVAKTTVKQMAEQKIDAAHQTASKKLDEVMGGKADAAKDANATGNATKEKAGEAKHEMHEMKGKAKHEMHEMKNK